MSSNPVVWFEIYVQDMNRAVKFYESVFQVDLKKLDSPIPGMEIRSFPSNMEGYGTTGALVKLDGVPSGGCGSLVYFHCDDCASVEPRVLTAGGEIHRNKMPIGEYGYISLVLDTEGNMIGLHSMK